MISNSVAATAGDNLKIDYSLGTEVDTTANYTFTCEYRLYRSGTLINTRVLNRTQSSAGTQRFMVSNTYVDTALLTTTYLYELRVIVIGATNVTSASCVNRAINMIVF